MFSEFEKIDKLKEAIKLCSIHNERMNFAFSKVISYCPLTIESYNHIDAEILSFFDQLIFRFSKLQDCMGAKLFTSILENLGEETKGKPFIDILSKLEELNLIESSKIWLNLRETRNIVTHEYPFVTEEVIDGLNMLFTHCQLISNIWDELKTFSLNKFSLTL